MRVIHILKELRPSGAEVMLELAGPVWRAAGCELHVLGTADSLGEFAPRLEAAGYHLHHLPSGRGARLPGWLWRYARLLGGLDPDVVHVHAEGLGVFLALIPALLGRKVFRTVHNNFLFDGRLRFQKRLERTLCRFLGVVFVAISEAVQNNELRRFGNAALLRWNWFDTAKFFPPSPEQRSAARQELDISEQALVLVSVGNGSEVKNYRSIIEALAALPSPATSPAGRPILYLQVGNEHPAGIDRSLAVEGKVTAAVRFCGPQKDVRKYLWAADVYTMPSHFEGFGLSFVEAAACGLPCMLADRPGLAEFRELGICAQWVEPDGDGVKRGIEALLAQPPETLLQGGLDNSQIVRNAFGIDRGARAYFDDWTGVTG